MRKQIRRLRRGQRGRCPPSHIDGIELLSSHDLRNLIHFLIETGQIILHQSRIPGNRVGREGTVQTGRGAEGNANVKAIPVLRLNAP